MSRSQRAGAAPASRRRRQVALTALAGLATLAAACGPPAGGRGEPAAGDPSPPATAPFVDRTAATGLDFVHVNGMSGRYYLAEVMGAGAALFDYDGDGDLDLYLVQGGPLGGAGWPAGQPPPGDRLYRNELAETGALAFTDVTATAGIVATGYGMGVAVGDVDGDGDPDLYLTNLGANQLWRNDGDGTFTEVAAAGGADDPRWSVPAVFFDADGDGDLDLYVGSYVDFTVAGHKDCFHDSTARDYCGPLSYRPQTDRLFANRGDGTFDDVSADSRIATERGAALGALAADLDGDGRLDLYVANDEGANRLWLGSGDGSFEDGALLAGCAFDAQGHAQGSMGVDAGDYDGDGDLDLFMTHFDDEANTLYRNDGGGLFTDVTFAAGLGHASRGFTGFGTAWLDHDGDGDLDLVTVNGAVRVKVPLAAGGDPYPLHEINQLFDNRGGGRLEEITAAAGEAFARSEVSRAAVFGDLDDDGDLDVVVTNNAGPVRLLVNRAGDGRRWLGVRLVGAAGGDAYGATAGLALTDGRVLWRRVRADGSYLAAGDPRLLFALGDAEPVELTVRWPDGAIEAWTAGALAAGAYTALVRGGGPPAAGGAPG